MGSGVFFPICAIPFSLLVIILFFKKEHVKNPETKIYQVLIVSNLIGLIIEVLCTYASIIHGEMPGLSNFIYKSYLVYLITWTSLFTLYIYTISKKNHERINNAKKMLFSTIYFIAISLIYVLPIELVLKDNFQTRYTTGPGVSFTYLICGILVGVILVMLIKNIKNILTRKYIPVFVFFIVGTLSMIIQYVFPQLLLLTYAETFVCVIMYFTIENPDLQMLREFHKAREYAENSNMEKSNFLFAMAKEVKEPILKINRISKNVLMQDDMELIKHNVSQIKYSSNNLLELVNKVLDINSIESRKVSVRESKYNTSNLFKGIISQTELKLKEKVVEFRPKYDETIPKELYGDSIRIRQIINTLLDNAIKHTDEGFIELNVNSIVKHDICRLIITVEDSGKGMSQDIVEHILDKNINKIDKIDDAKMDLGLVKTLLDLIGGTVMVNSEQGRGTKFTIVIDQKIVNAKSSKTIETVEKYEELYLNNKRVMLVINDEKLSKQLNTYLKKYPIEVVTVSMGQTCLERIRNNEKYDLIIMEDNLEKLSHENTLRKLKDIQGFKTPVVLLTNLKEINEREEYLKLGFTEVVTLPIKKEQVSELAHTYKFEE